MKQDYAIILMPHVIKMMVALPEGEDGMSSRKTARIWNYLTLNATLYCMLVPAIVLVFIFNYVPMYGLIIAFQDYQPTSGFWGSRFVGLDWFKLMVAMPDFKQILWNTVVIALLKIVIGTIVAIVFSLLLHEIRSKIFKRSVQTLTYLPYFLSWVIIGGIFINILSTNGGLINNVLQQLGFDPIFFLGSNTWFRPTVIFTDIWKNFGWNSILYLAALAGINEELYETAVIDGANRWKQTVYVTLPGISSTIILLACLSLGGILSAGFEQILVLYNPAVYQTGDILDTFLYRMGLVDGQFSLGAALGLMQAIVGFLLILLSYKLAERYANYRIF